MKKHEFLANQNEVFELLEKGYSTLQVYEIIKNKMTMKYNAFRLYVREIKNTPKRKNKENTLVKTKQKIQKREPQPVEEKRALKEPEPRFGEVKKPFKEKF